MYVCRLVLRNLQHYNAFMYPNDILPFHHGIQRVSGMGESGEFGEVRGVSWGGQGCQLGRSVGTVFYKHQRPLHSFNSFAHVSMES